jgi:hypothetical protein
MRNQRHKRPIEEIIEEVREDNPDPTTRRETFELDLMEQHRVNEGRDVQVNADSTEP